MEKQLKYGIKLALLNNMYNSKNITYREYELIKNELKQKHGILSV